MAVGFKPHLAWGQNRILRPSAAASDWWLSGGISAANAIAVYQPKGAASLAASYTDLTGNGNTASVISAAPTWDSTNGWKRAAGSGDLNSNVIIENSGWSVFWRFSNYTAAAFDHIGQNAVNKRYVIALSDSAGAHAYYNNDQLKILTPLSSSGVIGMAGQEGFLDGSSEGAITESWSGGVTPLYLLTCNGLSGTNLADTLYIQAVAIYDTTLTSDQVAAVSTAMAAL